MFTYLEANNYKLYRPIRYALGNRSTSSLTQYMRIHSEIDFYYRQFIYSANQEYFHTRISISVTLMLLLTTYEAHTRKYSDLSFDKWTESSEVLTKILKSEYFPHGTNNWLTRAVLYSHHELMENFRRVVRKLMKYHSKPNFVRTKLKH